MGVVTVGTRLAEPVGWIVDDDLLLLIGSVAGVLALVLLIVRARRRPPLTLGITHAPPRRLAVRASSLSRHIDDAFDELEIKPVRLPSIELELELDDAQARPRRPAAHSMFDTSDSPLEVSDELLTEFPIEPTLYEAAAFGAEPTVTVVDDDGTSPVDELAAFLARDEHTATTPPRAARGSHVPIDPRAPVLRGDLRGALRSRQQTLAGPYVDITRGRADTAQTPS